MEEDKTVVDETTNVEETTENNEISEQTAKQGLSAETLLVQKNKYKEQAEALRAENEALKAKVPVKKEENVSIDNERLAAIEFKVANPSLDSDTINKIFKLAKAEGVSPEEALKDPMIEAFLEKKTRDAQNQAAMPNGGGKHFIKTDKPIKEMDEEEFKKVWAENRTKK